jgi:hypothetical protein
MRILKDKDGNVLVANGKVAAATASLDPNIVPGNIKKNVKILGVTGNYGGGGDEPKGDVTFIDYDGSVVCTYTTDEFLNLSEMPANPTHEGLVAQGWNWGIDDAQEYVDKHGKLIIGQMYTTDDGASRMYVSLPDTRKSPVITCGIRNSEGSLYVDWGDGSEPDEMTFMGQSMDIDGITYEGCFGTHDYDEPGDYVISITRDNPNGHYGMYGIRDNNNNAVYYNPFITNFEAGDGLIGLGEEMFYESALKSVSLSRDIEIIMAGCFYGSFFLKDIVFPENIGYVKTECFAACKNLRNVSLSPNISKIEDSAFDSTSIDLITIPDSVSRIYSNCFSYSSLEEIILPDNNDFITLESECFAGCVLKDIILPNTLTNIYDNVFTDTMYLTELTIPENVETIGEHLICNGEYNVQIKYIHMLPTTPPTISEHTFENLPSDTIVYVPVGCGNTYRNAQYWSNISSRIYEEGITPTPPQVQN